MSTVLTLLQELSRAAVRETGVLAVLAMRVCAYVCGCSWIATPLARVFLVALVCWYACPDSTCL